MLKHKKNVNIKIVLLLTISLFFLKAHSQEPQINVTASTTTLKSLIEKIENETDYTFIFNSSIDLNTKVALNVGVQTIESALNQALANTGVTYEIASKQILLLTRNSRVATQSSQNTKVISGYVTTENGEPVLGATVAVRRTSIATITDVSGRFSLEVPTNAILAISYLGHETQEISVSGRTDFRIKLKEDEKLLDEVVVIGYGTAKRRDLTGSIGRISSSDLENKSANNILDFLRGTVAGFNTNMSTSAKGGGSMLIRGRTSLTAETDPLLVVDGVIYNGELSDINPADIQSVDVLKDGSAAAVYGTRAAAGVLAITTKKGTSEKPEVNFSASWGLSNLTTVQEVYSPEEYILMKGDARRSLAGFTKPSYYYQNPNQLPEGIDLNTWLDGSVGDPMEIWLQGRLQMTQIEIDNYFAGLTTDWMNQVFQLGLRQDYNVSISGKSKRSSHYFSFGYLNNEGIILGDQYQTFRSRLNLTTDPTDWLQIGTNLQFSDRDQSTNPASYSNAVKSSPYGSMYQEDGVTLRWFPHDDILASNPFNNYAAELMDKNRNLVANLFANVSLPFGIKYHVTFNNRYSFSQTYNFYSIDTYTGRKTLTEDGQLLGGSASRRDYTNYSWQLDNILTWNKTFADIHKLDLTFLYNAEKTQYWTGTVNASQFSPSDALGFHNMAVGVSTNLSVSNNDVYATGNAVMGRVNYGLMDKYLLTASVRKDGYSAFGINHPYAVFPALALAWRLSEESFMNWSDNWLDHMKLRLSYGINGNRSIGTYAALANVSSGGNIVDGSYAIRIYNNKLANYDLKWEKTTAYNAGMDFTILNNRLNGSIEGYYTSTTDLLVTRALPYIIGYTTVTANLGEVTNKGMEVTLTSTNIKNSNFNWSSSFTFSFNRNKIKHLYGTMQDVLDDSGNVIGQREADDTSNGWYIGRSIDEIYNYEVIGVWQSDEAEEAAKYGRVPGDIKLRDVRNFEGRVEGIRSDEDRVFQGYTTPRYRFGLKNDFFLLNCIDVSFFLRSDVGHKGSISNYKHASGTFNEERLNAYKFPYWTPENPTTDAARIGGGTSPDFVYWKSRSFLRLQDVSVAYVFSKEILSSLQIERAKIYVNASNLFVLTGWDYWDPETMVPTPRVFSLGINVTL